METEYKKVKAIMASSPASGSEEPPARREGLTARRDAEVVTEVPDGVTQAKQHLMKAANLMLICMESARYVAKQWEERHEHTQIPNEHFQGICSTFFIEASRMRFIDRMPPRPISK